MAKTSNFSQTPSIEELWPEFETLDDARDRRVRLVRQLLHGDHSAQQLAVKLADCRDRRRCGSPICPMCVRALRRWFVCETVTCINGLLSSNPSGLRGRVVSFLAIPAEEHRFGKGALPDLKRLNRTLQRRFQRDKFPLAFSGVDVSLNLFNNSIGRARWQPHLYGLVVGLTREEVKEALSAYYPPRKRAQRPVHVKNCNSLPPVLSYCIKPYFSRHSGYRDRRKNNRAEPLKGSQVQELAIWLDQYKLADRYLLRGCRKRGQHLVINPAVKAELLGGKRGQN
jgi:hypothetical protein